MTIELIEVGPRDGLQNESRIFSVDERVKLIELLSLCGFAEIEVGSFVSPKWVPQMAHTDEVCGRLPTVPHTRFSALVPNEKGLTDALTTPIKNISVFTAASDAFTQKNINCSVADSLNRFKPLIKTARDHGLRVRGYVSCAVACPFSGAISPNQTRQVAKALWEMGCAEISLGDTIGKGTPETIRQMIKIVCKEVPIDALAIHCHDTYGLALENVHAALIEGVTKVDAAINGLGGCPYGGANAKGNVSTQAVYALLQKQGYKTSLDTDALKKAQMWVSNVLGT